MGADIPGILQYILPPYQRQGMEHFRRLPLAIAHVSRQYSHPLSKSNFGGSVTRDGLLNLVDLHKGVLKSYLAEATPRWLSQQNSTLDQAFGSHLGLTPFPV